MVAFANIDYTASIGSIGAAGRFSDSAVYLSTVLNAQIEVQLDEFLLWL